ncbi:P-loop containing nucleoside triphosphate hydrolase protein [Mucor mucedo]|uniref:P-loop containing nucleoside triphosphate hydrolase protein n=1 Tax=Mucor mucedo TaxID=29922 RepID=UPI00221EDF6D|nr:P-loop containing nucleoside triphosphate hydrolase protein [Mucor mucedo]KAI7894415.1 P-loop containing nucleoside triphosphate hydrolase protein [Mucor mucedo]
MEKFIAHQIELVETERKIDVEDTLKLLSAYAPIQLQRRGVALVGLKVTGMRTGLGGKSLIDLELANPNILPPIFPAHKITTGDIVGLDEYKKDKPSKQAARWSGVVLRVSDARITVALQEMEEELPTEIQERCQIVKLANSVTYERMLKGLERLQKKSQEGGSNLTNVLLGQSDLSTPQLMDDIQFFDETLNDSQKEAVRFALGSPEISLIHGPPGTGKTYTLVEIIRQLSVNQNKRVLVCGPSNISVDNLVERLAQHRLNIVRIGHPARVLPSVVDHTLDVITRTCDSGQIVSDVRKEMDETLLKIRKSKNRSERRSMYGLVKDLRKDYRVRERKVVDEVLTSAQVTISTLNGSGSRNMWNREFDVVIIDEATQALEAECWIALLKAKKAILAGDHLQLPPTIKTPIKPSSKPKKKGGMSTDSDLSTTLFDRLLSMYGDRVKRMLMVQYRMHQKIMEFSSKELYDNKLVADKSVAEHVLADLPGVTSSENTDVPLVMMDTSDTGLAHEMMDDAQEEQSKANELEVELTVYHIKALLEDGLEQDQIGVITPYAAQVSKLKRDIREHWPNIEVGTVDGFQGREKEAILLSLVRSNDSGEVGFLAEKRRLNVAMTRAKRHLCVICDSETLLGTKGGSKPTPRFDGGFLKRWMEYLSDESDLRFSEFVTSV